MTAARVLLIDDSEVVRDLHSFLLQSGGYEVYTATNGSEALEKAVMSRFDLIITDINMPQMDGYEFIRHIRITPGYESTPIIIVSTESEARDKRKGFEVGANAYVVKPAKVNSLLGNARLLLAAHSVSPV